VRKGVLVLVAGAAAAAFAWRRRTAGGERVDLYFADGSMFSLAGDSDHWQRLVSLAKDVLAAART
jgi:hypothetical protein